MTRNSPHDPTHVVEAAHRLGIEERSEGAVVLWFLPGFAGYLAGVHDDLESAVLAGFDYFGSLPSDAAETFSLADWQERSERFLAKSLEAPGLPAWVAEEIEAWDDAPRPYHDLEDLEADAGV